MKTFVLWTHYECEVYVTLHPTAEAAWDTLKVGWLDDCSEDDCGHVPDEMTIEEIAEAVEYHWDELNYSIDAHEVSQEQVTLTAERVERPTEQNAMPAEKAEDLLSRLQTFQGS